MIQPTLVMKPSESTLNILFKTALLAACFCLSTGTTLFAERFVKLHIKNDTSATFSVPTNREDLDSISSFNLNATSSIGSLSPHKWMEAYHNVKQSFVYYQLMPGEKCTYLNFKSYDDTVSKTKRNIRANIYTAVDYEHLDNNDSFSVGESVYGPCLIRFGLMPEVYRAKESFNYRYGSGYKTVYANDGSFVFGLGSITYVPTEAYINLKIEGTPTDTSVGSTVGGGTSGSTSGKNYVTVIPENSPTDVRIVLEQSTDLINWTSANQGVFSPSTSRRFFRVRAEEE